MNPCTLGWYLPLLVKDVPGALQPSDGERHQDDAGGPSNPSTTGTHSGRAISNAGTGRDGQKSRNGSGSASAAESHHHHHHRTQGEVTTSNRKQQAPQVTSVSASAEGTSSDEESSSVSPASSHPGAVSGNATWKDLDSKFRRDLPDDVYAARLVYRGMVMRACPGIRMLDGVETSEKEREKAEKILKGMIGINREKKKTIAGAGVAGAVAATAGGSMGAKGKTVSS